jgi:hypothetical protein
MYSTTWQILQHYRESVILEDDGPVRSPPPAGGFRQGNPFDRGRLNPGGNRRHRYQLTPDTLSPLSPHSPRSSSPEDGYASSNTSASSYNERKAKAKEIRARRSPNGSDSGGWPSDLKLKKTNGATRLDSENLPMWKYTQAQLDGQESPPPPLPPKNALRNSLQRLPANPAVKKEERATGLRRGQREDSQPSPGYRRNGPPLRVDIPNNSRAQPQRMDRDGSAEGSLRRGLRRGGNENRNNSNGSNGKDSFSTENARGKRPPPVANPFARKKGDTQMPEQPVSKFSHDESMDEEFSDPFARRRANNTEDRWSKRHGSVFSFDQSPRQNDLSNWPPRKDSRESNIGPNSASSTDQVRPSFGSNFGEKSPHGLSNMIRGNLRSPSEYEGTPGAPPSSSYPKSGGFTKHLRKDTTGSVTSANLNSPFAQPNYYGRDSPTSAYPREEGLGLRYPEYSESPKQPQQPSYEFSPRSDVPPAMRRPEDDMSQRTPRDIAESPLPPPPPPKNDLPGGPRGGFQLSEDPTPAPLRTPNRRRQPPRKVAELPKQPPRQFNMTPDLTPRSNGPPSGYMLANSPSPVPASDRYGGGQRSEALRFDNLGPDQDFGARSPVPRYSPNPAVMQDGRNNNPYANPYASNYDDGPGPRAPASATNFDRLAPPSADMPYGQAARRRSNTMDSDSTSPYDSQGNSTRSGFSRGRPESIFSSASSNSSIPVGASAFGRLSSGTGGPGQMGANQYRRGAPSPSINVQSDAGLGGGPYPPRSGGRNPYPPKAPSAGRGVGLGPPPGQFPMLSPSGSRLQPSPGPGGRIMNRGMPSPGGPPLPAGPPGLPAGPGPRRGLPGGNPRIGRPLPAAPGMANTPVRHKRMGSNFSGVSTGSGPSAVGRPKDPLGMANTLGNGPYPSSAPSTSGLPRNGPRPGNGPPLPGAPGAPPSRGPTPAPGGRGGGLPGGPASGLPSGPGPRRPPPPDQAISDPMPLRRPRPPPQGSTGRKGRPLPPGAGFGLPGVPKNVRAGVPGRPAPMRV